MMLKKTACLTALLMSFPYAATAADWREHEVSSWEPVVSASGTETAPYEKTLNAEYDNVWFGRAENWHLGTAVANYNYGTLKEGFILTGKMYGGSAETGLTDNPLI